MDVALTVKGAACIRREPNPDTKLNYQDLLKNLRRISKSGLSYVIQQLTARRQTNVPPPAPVASPQSVDTGDVKGAPGNRGSANAPGTSGGAMAAQDQKKGRIALPPNMEPTYYIGGYNGTAIIDEILSSGLGWKRTKDKLDETYKFKWCELKSAINYQSFKEGEQIVNHIPNCQLLTNKLGLLNSLQEYDRVCATVKRRVPKLDFLPETFRLSEHKHREAFLQQYKEGEVWICKPTGRNQGKGIYLVRNIDDVKQIVDVHNNWNDQCALRGKPKQSLNRIIQRYITNPLLLNGKKFDIRAYMLIACMTPYLVLYHKGYVRLSIHDYDTSCDDLIAHLTNQFIQKKDPTYKQVKEETTWSMDKFNDYINQNVASKKGLEENWVYHTMTNRVKQIMLYCFMAVKHKFHSKTGYFDLYGFDFMVDEDMKVWLIEVNVNPCLATNCKALADVVPRVVQETIYISVECFEKARRSKPLFPLKALETFEIIFSDTPKVGYMNPPRSTTAQQLAPPSDAKGRISSLSPLAPPRHALGRIPSLSPHRQASTKDVASASQKGHESESKGANTKPHQSATTAKEGTSNKTDTLTSNQGDKSHDVSDSAKSVPEESGSDEMDSKKELAEKSVVDPAAGDSITKKASSAKPSENESDSKEALPEKLASETAAERAASTKSASDSSTKKESAAKPAENHSSDESDSKKISSTKSATKHASNSSDQKTLSLTKPTSDDGHSRRASPGKSTEVHRRSSGDSKKGRGGESNTNKPVLPSTSEPNSQSLQSDAKQPHGGRSSVHKLPSLPTPAPPLVSGIERLANSPYAEPVTLKMTHSSAGEHKKGKGARLDGKQSRGS